MRRRLLFRFSLALDATSWMFILLGCAAILVDQFTHSDVRVQLISLSCYGISLVVGVAYVLLRIAAGWWLLIANAVLGPVAAVYASVFYAPYPEGHPSGMPWPITILCVVLIASSIVQAVYNPWRWRNYKGTRGSQERMATPHTYT